MPKLGTCLPNHEALHVYRRAQSASTVYSLSVYMYCVIRHQPKSNRSQQVKFARHHGAESARGPTNPELVEALFAGRAPLPPWRITSKLHGTPRICHPNARSLNSSRTLRLPLNFLMPYTRRRSNEHCVAARGLTAPCLHPTHLPHGRFYEEIGSGQFSTVYKGRVKRTMSSLPFALRSGSSQSHDRGSGQHSLDHGNIVKFHAWFATPNHLWVVSEYCRRRPCT